MAHPSSRAGPARCAASQPWLMAPTLCHAGGEYPPTVYVSMEQDRDTAERIRENVQVLRDMGVPVQMIKVRLHEHLATARAAQPAGPASLNVASY